MTFFLQFKLNATRAKINILTRKLQKLVEKRNRLVAEQQMNFNYQTQIPVPIPQSSKEINFGLHEVKAEQVCEAQDVWER